MSVQSCRVCGASVYANNLRHSASGWPVLVPNTTLDSGSHLDGSPRVTDPINRVLELLNAAHSVKGSESTPKRRRGVQAWVALLLSLFSFFWLPPAFASQPPSPPPSLLWSPQVRWGSC